MLIIFTITWLLLTFLAPLFAMDRLIAIQYEKFNEKWVSDGRPNGFFYSAEATPGLAEPWRRSIARNRLSRRWLVSSPEWLRQSTEATVILWSVRVISFANLGLILFVLSGIFWT